MQKMFARLLGTILMVLGLTACTGNQIERLSPIPVYKIDLQQGNLVTQEMVDKLKPGMTKRQVEFVLGRPVLENFYDINRWDYIYRLVDGPTGDEERYRLSVFFDGDTLSYFQGDFRPQNALEGASNQP